MSTKNPYELATLGMSHQELVTTLSASLYPGAKPESVALVLGYCKASRLDPMKKPVHIVPMAVKTGEKDQWGGDKKETRDVVMPGVGLYRTEAQRTGEYVGLSEPEFGPDMVLEYNDEEWVDTGETKPNGQAKRVKKLVPKSLTYPDWCRITVERLVQGEVRKFTAKEYWIENYATKGRSNAPNEMWAKRVRGQLAKCTEAQALRKGFPDTSGEAPTYEEMEGKTGDLPPVDEVHKDDDKKDKKDDKPTGWPAEKFSVQLQRAKEAIGKKEATANDVIMALSTRGALSPDQEKAIRDLEVTDVTAKGEEPAGQAASTEGASTDDAGQSAEPEKITYAVIMDKVVKATDTDQLDELMSLVGKVPKDQRPELFDKIDARRDQLLQADE